MPVGRSHPHARCSLEAVGVGVEAAAGNDDARPTGSSVSGILVRDMSCPFSVQGDALSRSNDVALSATQAQASVRDVRMSRSNTIEFVFDSAHVSCTSISPPHFCGNNSVDQQMDVEFFAESTADAQDNSNGRLDRHGSIFGRASLVHEDSPTGRLRDDTHVGNAIDCEMSEPGAVSEFGDLSSCRWMLDFFDFESLHSLEAYGIMTNAREIDVPETPICRTDARGTCPPPPIFSDEPPPPLRKAIERKSESEVRAILVEDPSLATMPFMDHRWELPITYATSIGLGRSHRIIDLLLENGAEWSDADTRRQALKGVYMDPAYRVEYFQYFSNPVDLILNAR